MINAALPASNSVYDGEKQFSYNKFTSPKVEWYRRAMVKELLPGADELLQVRLPAKQSFDSQFVHFFVFSFCFSILFFLLACLSLLTLTTDSLRGFCDNVFPVTWHLCGLPIARAFTLYHTKKTKLLEIRYRENLAKL